MRADVRLAEEKVVIGTILAKCTQARWRRERMHRMRVHVGQLVRNIQRGRLRAPTAKDADEEELMGALRKAWLAWDYAMRNPAFGARSFGLIVLGAVCEMLEKLEKLDRDDDDLGMDEAGEYDQDGEAAAAPHLHRTTTAPCSSASYH